MVYLFDCPLSVHDALVGALAGFLNVIGPAPGQPAIAEQTVDGVTIPARPAIGDTAREYVNVRVVPDDAPGPAFPEDCAASDPAVSVQLLGVWAMADGRRVVAWLP